MNLVAALERTVERLASSEDERAEAMPQLAEVVDASLNRTP